MFNQTSPNQSGGAKSFVEVLGWILLLTALQALCPPRIAADTATPIPTPMLSPSPTATPTAWASPRPTITLTLTSTVSPTPVVPPGVKVNHNQFDPLRGQTLMIFGLEEWHGSVSVAVYNQAGYCLRQWSASAAGPDLFWDGRNEQGQVVASGVYVIVLKGYRLDKRFRVAVIK